MITLERAEKFIGKEVDYMDKKSTIKSVRRLKEDKVDMILAYTDLPLTVSIEILRTKDKEGKWKFIS